MDESLNRELTRRERLVELRDRLRSDIAETYDPNGLSKLSKEYRETLKELENILDEKKVNTIDDINNGKHLRGRGRTPEV